jgi:DNA-binding transcriptional regulator YiaG
MPELTTETIRRLRRVYGPSREAFAERLGVSVNAVRDWEQGRHQPRGATHRALAALLRALPAEPDDGMAEQ